MLRRLTYLKVSENVKTVEIPVVRRHASGGSASVKYRTVGITATAGEDFEAAQGTINFGTGVSRQTIKVNIIDDNKEEEDEIFTVRPHSALPACSRPGR